MQHLKETTDYRRSLRDKILETAMHLFAQRGVRAVRMDDIAQQLGISKRTLYEIYDDKEQLLFEGVRKYDQQRKDSMSEFAQKADNVMDVILEEYSRKAEETRLTCPQFLADIQKYPKVVAYMQEQHERSHEAVQQFLQRGVSEGYFRNDVDYDLVNTLFEAVGQQVMKSQLFSQYSFEHLFNNLLLVPLRGFCTAKGLQVLENRLH